MVPMPEVDIENVLLETLAYTRQDNGRLLHDFFGNRPEGEQNDIYRFFNEGSISIAQAYVQSPRTAPLISVLPGDGGTTDNYVGDFIGTELDDDNITTLYLIGERQHSTVEVTAESLNKNQTSYMAAFIKGALLVHRARLNNAGLNEMTMDWQRLEIDNVVAVTPLFRYTISVSFTYNIVVAQRYGPTPSLVGVGDIIPIPDPVDLHPEDRDFLDPARLRNR